MKAVVTTGPDGLNGLAVQDIASPEPSAGEVRVKLKAAALNRRDYWITLGAYPGVTFPCVTGSDGAGVVDAVGEGVSDNLLGQDVVIYPARNWGDSPACAGPDFEILGFPRQGTLAEYICVPAEYVYSKPAHLSWQQAAAVPLAGLTSWRAVVTEGQLQPGQTMLVTGAGSGVSTFAILWGVAMGAEVYVSSGSDDKIAMAKKLGARDGENYRDADCYSKLQQAAGGFDLIIDSAAGDTLNKLLGTLKRAGRYVFFGATLGNPSEGLNIRQLFFNYTRIQGTTMGSPGEFKAMLEFVSERKIEPVVGEVLPIDRAVDAFGLLKSFSQTGKVVLEFGQ